MGLNPPPTSPKAMQMRKTIPPGPGTLPLERTWLRGPPLQGHLNTLSSGAAPGALGLPPQQQGTLRAQVRAWLGREGAFMHPFQGFQKDPPK